MSNGQTDPPPSGSPYIIICNGRIGVKLAKSTDETIKAASQCANDLSLYMGMRYRQTFDPADLGAISELQHWLMDNTEGKKAEIESTVAVMFDLFDALEQKYAGASY